MIYAITKKSTGFAPSEECASVSGDIDIATFECARMNMQNTDRDVYFYIQKSDSDAGLIECEIEGDELLITDGEYEVALSHEERISYHEDRTHEEGPVSEETYIEIVNIKMLGTHIDDLAISDELRQDIKEKAEELGDYLTKNR